jgi:putative FmdB family regulatory protein
MPTYEYQCTACQNRFERFQKFADPPVSECPECGSAVRKVLFAAGVVFKGSGWYITDSRKSTPSEGVASSGSADGKSDGKSDVKTEAKSESKPESKSESKSESSSTKSEGSSKATTPAKS